MEETQIDNLEKNKLKQKVIAEQNIQKKDEIYKILVKSLAEKVNSEGCNLNPDEEKLLIEAEKYL